MPHTRYRSGLELRMEVLRACATPKRQTNVMYEARVSWTTIVALLRSLVEGGYLDFRPEEERRGRPPRNRTLGLYTITSKGAEALRKFESLNGGLLKGGRGFRP